MGNVSSSFQPVNRVLTDIGPMNLPNPADDAIAKDCRIHELGIVNDSGSTATVSVYDKQGTPVAFIPSMTLGPGAFISYESTKGGRLMQGGIRWFSSQVGVTGWILVQLTQ
jgi:hypothetical protein